jgi:hypothetical protein
MSPPSQHATHFLSAQPAYLIRIPFTVDLTINESQNDKEVEEDNQKN